MLCLSDTDLILKLACLDILEEAIQTLGVSRTEVRVTPETERFLSKSAFTSHPHDAVRKALKFVKGMREVPDVDLEELVLLDQPNIDYGERVLFASTAHLKSDTFYLATGDKRSLRALAAATGCDGIRQRLAGRVACLECLVLLVLDQKGFPWLLKRARAGCACDECMRSAFADGSNRANEVDCRKWLLSYFHKLLSETGALLYFPR